MMFGVFFVQDKYVVLGPGDNLGKLAKDNGTTVADIAKWNGVRDTRQLGVGVRLIVAKGSPTQQQEFNSPARTLVCTPYIRIAGNVAMAYQSGSRFQSHVAERNTTSTIPRWDCKHIGFGDGYSRDPVHSPVQTRISPSG